jgi:ketosteroid isomerase-like protein
MTASNPTGGTVDRQSLQTWLDRYVDAWKSYDPEAIGSLFAEGATYRYHPYDPDDETVRGREAIVRDWVEPDGNASTRDQPGTYDAHYEPYAIDGDRAVAFGTSSYWTDASRSTLERIYYNVFLMRFDADGRCTEFTEYFLKGPDAA